MGANVYECPTDIFRFFREEKVLNEFVFFLFDALENDIETNIENSGYIAPVFFNAKAKVFNVHWNFLVDCLAKFVGESIVKDDFILSEGMSNIDNMKMLWFGLFVFKYRVGYYSFYGKYRPESLPLYVPIVFERNGTKMKMAAVNFYASKVKEIMGNLGFQRVMKMITTCEAEMVLFRKEAATYSCESL